MLKIALTGNIASGKTQVQHILESLGFKVLDTDIVCHELLESNAAIEAAFSNYDIFDNGKISRDKLGKLVFSNLDLKTMLEHLIYPDLVSEIKTFFDKNTDKKIVFVAVPQLFEAGMEGLFDKTVTVYCDDKIRMERLIKRSGFSRRYAQLRLVSQMDQKEKVKRSDFVICNNSNIEDLNTEVANFISKNF